VEVAYSRRLRASETVTRVQKKMRGNNIRVRRGVARMAQRRRACGKRAQQAQQAACVTLRYVEEPPIWRRSVWRCVQRSAAWREGVRTRQAARRSVCALRNRRA